MLFPIWIMRSTTFVMICFAWILFRANNLSDAAYVVTHLASGWDISSIKTVQFTLRQLPVAVVAIAVLEVGQHWPVFGADWVEPMLRRTPVPVRWAAYAAGVLFVVMFGVYQMTQFIYFQF